MTKLHTKQQKMTSRRAVAPVIATLLLVAIAVVGGSIIFVFSQGFFSSAQISGAPNVESLEYVGYDASDILVLTLHDGNNSTNAGSPGAWDQANADDGLVIGDRIAVYVQNQSAQRVTIQELTLAGVVYDYPSTAPAAALTAHTADPPADGEFIILTNGNAGTAATVKTETTPVLEAGEEATLLLSLERGLSEGRDVQVKIETGTGAIFVGTILAGQQSG